MIIYTPLDMNDIFPPEETEWKNRKSVPIENGMVTIEKNEDHSWQVCALHSSNPQDYLLSKYQPGNLWSGE